MTSPKARYVGDGSGNITPDFPESLRKKLRESLVEATKFSPKQIIAYTEFQARLGKDNWAWTHPVDEIVSALLVAAYESKVSLNAHKRLALKKGELLAEHADLLNVLRTTRKRLRSISLDLDRMLGIELFDTNSDPLGIADHLDVLISSLEAVVPLVQKHSGRPRDRVFSNGVAQQLACEVLRVFAQNGIPTTVRRKDDPGPLIATLTSIGEAMGLRLSANTWINAVSAARRSTKH